MALLAALNILLGMNAAGVAAGASKSNRALKGVQQHAHETALSLKSIEGALGAAGIGLGAYELVNFLKESAIAAREQRAEERKLESVLQSTGHAAGYTAEQLKAYAAELQRTTNYGDEMTIGAAAVLATFTQIKGLQFSQAIGSIQDISAVLGQDLQSSAVQVGKALNDPIRGLTALRRVGVSFSSDQEQVIRRLVQTGDVAGAQNVILRELSTEFGGSAAAMRDDLTGLVNDFGDLKEAIGAAAASGGLLGTLAAEVRALTETLNEHAQGKGNGPGWFLSDWFSHGLDSIHDQQMEAARLEAVQRARAQGAGPAAAPALDTAALDAAQDNFDALDKLTEKLKQEAQLQGLTGTAREIAALKLRGLTEAEVTDARALAQRNQQLAAAAKTAQLADAIRQEILLYGLEGNSLKLAQLARQGASQAALEQVASQMRLNDAMQKYVQQQKESLTAAEQFAKSAESTRQSLEEQVATFGMDERAAEKYRLQLRATAAAKDAIAASERIGAIGQERKQLAEQASRAGDLHKRQEQMAERAAQLPQGSDEQSNASRAAEWLGAQAAAADDARARLVALDQEEQRLLERQAAAGRERQELAGANAANEKLAQLEQQKKTFDELQKSWTDLYEETRTPAEKYAAELDRLEKLHQDFRAEVARRITAGQMTAEQGQQAEGRADQVFDRAKEQARERFGDTETRGQGHRANAAITRGSVEEYSTLIHLVTPRQTAEKQSLAELKAIRRAIYEQGKAERRKEKPATLRRI